MLDNNDSYDWDGHGKLVSHLCRLGDIHTGTRPRTRKAGVEKHDVLIGDLRARFNAFDTKIPKKEFADILTTHMNNMLKSADCVADHVAARSYHGVELLRDMMIHLPEQKWTAKMEREFMRVETDLHTLHQELIYLGAIYGSCFFKNPDTAAWRDAQNTLCVQKDEFSDLQEEWIKYGPTNVPQESLAQRSFALAGHFDRLSKSNLEYIEAKTALAQYCLEGYGTMRLIIKDAKSEGGKSLLAIQSVGQHFLTSSYLDLDDNQNIRRAAYRMAEIKSPVFITGP